MIDWEKPIRLVKNRRRVYVTGYLKGQWEQGRMVGSDNRMGSGGIAYDNRGLPQIVCPWGEIENFDPLAEMLLDTRDVPSPAERRAQRQLVQESEDNPLFGAWS